MRWRRVFQDHWPYKVAAVVLALLLWFNVSANEDRAEQEIATRVEFDLHDREWVPMGVPEQVRTTFRGRLGDMLDLAVNRPVILLTVESVTDSVMRVTLDPSMVQYDRRLRVQPVSVRPPVLDIRFRPAGERRLPVRGNVRVSPADGHVLLGEPVIAPETVTVRGASDELDRLLEVETESLSLEGLTRTTSRAASLRFPPGLVTLAAEPSEVEVTVRADSLVERRIRVPVRVEGPGGRAVSLHPQTVELGIRGPARVVSELPLGSVAARVVLPNPPPARELHRVEILLPEGLQVTAEARPPSVTVEPTAGGGGGP